MTKEEILQIAEDYQKTVKQRLDELLEADSNMYTNLGTDSTKAEKEDVRKARYNLTGYHTHQVFGQTNYMGGLSHAQIVQVVNSSTNPLNSTTTIIGTPSSSGGSPGGY